MLKLRGVHDDDDKNRSSSAAAAERENIKKCQASGLPFIKKIENAMNKASYERPRGCRKSYYYIDLLVVVIIMDSTIDPSVCLQAIREFFNPSISPAQYQQYQQYLISLRENPSYGSALFSILSVEVDDGIRLFCLTALQEWTKRWWKEMGPAQQLELRGNISSVVSTIPETSSTSYCSKCASIIVEIAERQFPDQWSSFVDDLLSLWVTGSFQKQQTTLKTLHDLYTDCTDPDFTGQLSTTRRQEIISALQPYHSRIIALIREFLCNHLQLYLANQANPQYSCM